MADVVYHFTDTARLPWILAAEQLRAGRNKIGNFPDPDFIWATVDSRGDKTASLNLNALRDGSVLAVRLTCRTEDFEPWNSAWRSCPAWMQRHVDMLERVGRERGVGPENW